MMPKAKAKAKTHTANDGNHKLTFDAKMIKLLASAEKTEAEVAVKKAEAERNELQAALLRADFPKQQEASCFFLF